MKWKQKWTENENQDNWKESASEERRSAAADDDAT